jgi:hypothetical protein
MTPFCLGFSLHAVEENTAHAFPVILNLRLRLKLPRFIRFLFEVVSMMLAFAA